MANNLLHKGVALVTVGVQRKQEACAMGMMDNMQDKMGDMSDEARQRFDELRQKEQDGQLDDQGREELQQMRDRFSM